MNDRDIEILYNEVINRLGRLENLKTFEDYKEYNLKLLELIKEHGFNLVFLEAFTKDVSHLENYHDWYDSKNDDEYKNMDDVISIAHDWYIEFPQKFNTDNFVLDLNYTLR